ncbi:MAG: hypothetical protein COW08_07225 [Ignavibacteriales bacterium CG12_big_fil_rev_8_21_14_0_65_30_8]|nr:MAG: hypothetical protein COW08_07225 [Ignavibacteriales bacterium CG12_big_fil_rev_8_21_14_0_65_30_8]
MESEKLNIILDTIKYSEEYRGQLISTEYNYNLPCHQIELKKIKDNEKEIGSLLLSFFSRLKINALSSVELDIVKNILSGKDAYFVTVNNPYIKKIIDCAFIIKSFYYGKQVVYVTLEDYEQIVIRFKETFSNLVEYYHLKLSNSVISFDSDILIIHPSEIFETINPANLDKYPPFLLYDYFFINNIHLYDSRELCHIRMMINKLKQIRKEYNLEASGLNIALSSIPIYNRKEIAGLFYNANIDDSIINKDDTESNSFKTYFWKPSLTTDTEIEKIDEIQISRDNLRNEVRKLLSAIIKSGIGLKVLFWVNEIGVSKDFRESILNQFKKDDNDIQLEIRTIYSIEQLNYKDYYLYDLIIIINPANIRGYLLEQCSKLVNGENSIVILLLGEDHLSHQLLRSEKYSLEWKEEQYNLPRLFVLNADRLKELYDDQKSQFFKIYSDLFRSFDQ